MSSPSKTNADFSSGINIGGIQIHVGSTSATILTGAGLSSAKGSLYINTGGTTINNRIYVNTNGATTWTAITTAA